MAHIRASNKLSLIGGSILSGLLCFAGPSGWTVSADEGQHPDLTKGKQVFERFCAGCHGTYGQGDGYRLLGPQPADFTSPAVRHRPDSELLKTIHDGKPNMPSWKLRLSQKDSRDVLAYIRELSQR